MDRFECFVAGHKIGSGILHRNNTATSFGVVSNDRNVPIVSR